MLSSLCKNGIKRQKAQNAQEPPGDLEQEHL